MERITAINMKERVSRIEKFKVSVRFFTDGGPAELSLQTSERVSVTKSFLKKIKLLSEKILQDHGEGGAMVLNQTFTSLFRNALTFGEIYFEDEVQVSEGALVFETEAIGVGEEDDLVVKKSRWS